MGCLQFSASFNRCIDCIAKCCSLYLSVCLSFSLTCTYLLLFESPAWIVMIVNLIILPVKVCLEFLSSSEYLKSTLPTKPSGNSNADKILSFTLKWNEKKYNRGFRIKCFGLQITRQNFQRLYQDYLRLVLLSYYSHNFVKSHWKSW